MANVLARTFARQSMLVAWATAEVAAISMRRASSSCTMAVGSVAPRVDVIFLSAAGAAAHHKTSQDMSI